MKRSMAPARRRPCRRPWALLNGIVDEAMFARPKEKGRGRAKPRAPASALEARLRECETTAERVEHAFVALLVREPSADELADWIAILGAGALDARDLVWTLVNSHEFRFQR